jgi:ketosteroid isomerase-like protein
MEELDREYLEAFRQMDVDRIMACYWDSPDFIFVSFDGTVYRGTESVRNEIEKMLAGMESVRLEINEIDRVPSGDCILAVGTATFHLQPKDGPPQQSMERWTDVRRQVGGRWVYVLNHVHPLPPPDPQ